MNIFGSIQSLPESYGLAILLLKLSGLFPYDYIVEQNKFRISRKLLAVTVLHIGMYTYVNITSLLENWKDFAQPMIGHSSLTAFGNLILRLEAIIITFLILIPLLFGSRNFVSSLNTYVQIVEELVKLGIDVKCIYSRVYITSLLVAATTAITLIFTAWHSSFFYKLITNQPPALKYYLMAFLANFYKILFLFYGNLQLFTIYLLTKQLNRFVEDLITSFKKDFERQLRAKDILRKRNKMSWSFGEETLPY